MRDLARVSNGANQPAAGGRRHPHDDTEYRQLPRLGERGRPGLTQTLQAQCMFPGRLLRLVKFTLEVESSAVPVKGFSEGGDDDVGEPGLEPTDVRLVNGRRNVR